MATAELIRQEEAARSAAALQAAAEADHRAQVRRTAIAQPEHSSTHPTASLHGLPLLLRLFASLQEVESQLRQLMVMQDATLTALQQEKAAAAAATAEVESLRRALDGSHAEVADLRSQLATLHADREREAVQSAALRAGKAAAEERLSATAARLEEETRTAMQHRDAVAAQLAHLHSEVDIVGRRCQAAEGERDGLTVKLRESNARVASLLVDNGKLTEAVTALRTEMAALRTTNTLLSHGLRADAPAGPAPAHAYVPTPASRSPPPSASISASRPSTSPTGPPSPAHPAPPIPASSTAAAAALVRATLSAAGLDASEADRWFPAEAAPTRPRVPGGGGPVHVAARGAGVEAGTGGVGAAAALSPGASALAAALERTRARRMVREADGGGPASGVAASTRGPSE